MNYRRILLTAVLVTGSILFHPKPIFASEGTAFLTGPQTDTQCFAASVLTAPAEYRVLITCRNLITPPEAETLFYTAWAKKIAAEADSTNSLSKFGRSPYLFLGDITSGKLSARAREPFGRVFITAQKDSAPDSPDLESVVVSGDVEEINFTEPSGSVVDTIIASTPTPPGARVTTVPASSSSSRSVVGTAFRLFLVVVGVIVVAAVAISILQRRSAAK